MIRAALLALAIAPVDDELAAKDRAGSR